MECHHTSSGRTDGKVRHREQRMIKRVSFVWKRPELSDAEFRQLWLGEHVEYAKRLEGRREYVIDFILEGPNGGPSGIATLRFDPREALESAFGDPALSLD